jgi:hypothetical protein
MVDNSLSRNSFEEKLLQQLELEKTLALESLEINQVLSQKYLASAISFPINLLLENFNPGDKKLKNNK